MFFDTGCVPSTGGTGASTFQPFVTVVSGDIVSGAPPSIVAHTDVTPTSASTTVARIGIVTRELTSYDVPLGGDVIVTAGGLPSWRIATLFVCVVAACPLKPSDADNVSVTFAPVVAVGGMETVKLRVTCGAEANVDDVSVPVDAVSVSAVTATSSVAAAFTVMSWPA